MKLKPKGGLDEQSSNYIMKIDLNKEECNNVKAALLHLAKDPAITEDGMRVLLALSAQFNWMGEIQNYVEKGSGEEPSA